MGRYSVLESFGLTNSASEDYGVLASAKPFAYTPFCTSQACAGTKQKVIKSLAYRMMDCPDCGSSLVYKKPRKHRGKKNE